MGYPTELFIDQDISDGFLCAICHDVKKDPVSMNPCEHTYCRTCAEEWRQKSKTCPTDRQRVTSLKKVQRYFIDVLNELKMRCPFSGDGCTATFKLGDFTDHDERCPLNPENQKECGGGCGAILNQAQVKAKTHTCIGYLKQQLEDKDKLVQEKETEKMTELARSQELGQKVEEQNSQLESLQVELKKNETTLGEKEAQLKAKDAQLTSIRDRIKEMEHHMSICKWDERDTGVKGKLNQAQTPLIGIDDAPRVADFSPTTAAAVASSSRGHLKRKLDVEEKSEVETTTVTPNSTSAPITVSEVDCIDSKNISPELFHAIVNVVVDELQDWFLLEDRWDKTYCVDCTVRVAWKIEKMLSERKLPLDNVPGLDENGSWSTYISQNDTWLDNFWSVDAATRLILRVRDTNLQVYQRGQS